MSGYQLVPAPERCGPAGVDVADNFGTLPVGNMGGYYRFVIPKPSSMFSPIRLRPESRSCRVAAHVLAGLLASSAAVAQSLQLTLVPSDHNGYHISCFGKKDGAIDLSVSGGTPPYTYTWSTGATTQDVSGLPSGFISVMVRDAANGDGRGEITLTEPGALRADAVPYVYASGFNISCNSCYNGSIQVTPHDGVSPYTYAWTDGPMSQNRSMLDAGSYRVDVFDANGCMYKTENLVLTQPERDDWSKSGNAGTTPGTHFMGTTDNKDLVLKSNGAERLRLRSDGKIKLFGNDTTFGLLYRDVDGILKLGTGPTGPVAPGTPCVNDFTGWMPLWKTNGNAFPSICPENPQPRLGTLNGFPLRIITDDQERMIVTTQGKVGIGTTSPSARLHVNGDLLIRDEELGDMIATSTGKVGIGTSAPSSKLHVEGDLLVHDGENGDIVTSSNPTTGPVLWARNGVAAWGLSIDGDGRGISWGTGMTRSP